MYLDYRIEHDIESLRAACTSDSKAMVAIVNRGCATPLYVRPTWLRCNRMWALVMKPSLLSSTVEDWYYGFGRSIKRTYGLAGSVHLSALVNSARSGEHIKLWLAYHGRQIHVERSYRMVNPAYGFILIKDFEHARNLPIYLAAHV